MSTDTRSTRKKMSYDRILDVAARAVRRDGYAGVGVNDVMKEAGLTHGGFYAHFASRDAMLAKAIEHASEVISGSLPQSIDALRAKGMSPIRALVEIYLSEGHLASPENGCPVAALGSEMPRQTAELREVSCRRVQSLLKTITNVLPSGTPPEAAMVIMSTMVGALQMARVLGNNKDGKVFLAANRKALIDQYDRNGTDNVKH